jgi:hypothetical protein
LFQAPLKSNWYLSPWLSITTHSKLRKHVCDALNWISHPAQGLYREGELFPANVRIEIATIATMWHKETDGYHSQRDFSTLWIWTRHNRISQFNVSITKWPIWKRRTVVWHVWSAKLKGHAALLLTCLFTLSPFMKLNNII